MVLSTDAYVFAVWNEPCPWPATIDSKRGSAASWNSYFAAPRTADHENEGTARVRAPPAGTSWRGAASGGAALWWILFWGAEASAACDESSATTRRTTAPTTRGRRCSRPTSSTRGRMRLGSRRGRAQTDNADDPCRATRKCRRFARRPARRRTHHDEVSERRHNPQLQHPEHHDEPSAQRRISEGIACVLDEFHRGGRREDGK